MPVVHREDGRDGNLVGRRSSMHTAAVEFMGLGK